MYQRLRFRTNNPSQRDSCSSITLKTASNLAISNDALSLDSSWDKTDDSTLCCFLMSFSSSLKYFSGLEASSECTDSRWPFSFDGLIDSFDNCREEGGVRVHCLAKHQVIHVRKHWGETSALNDVHDRWRLLASGRGRRLGPTWLTIRRQGEEVSS